MFQIGLLDKDMKPMPIEKQTLTATTGDRSKPEKLTVETKDGKFVVPDPERRRSLDHLSVPRNGGREAGHRAFALHRKALRGVRQSGVALCVRHDG